MKKIVVLGTLDTKGREIGFLVESIVKAGGDPLVIDVGISDDRFYSPDISNSQVAKQVGKTTEELRQMKQFDAVRFMMQGASIVVSKLVEEKKVSGIISVGGSIGTAIATSVMKYLPIGFPKLQVSTVASGDIRPYIAEKDITITNSIVDIAGLNAISRKILSNAAYAVVGMSKNESEIQEDTAVERIGATMFGVTTPCLEAARRYLEDHCYEVTVFHAVGTGGRAMEDLIRAGYFKGVLDATTTELADELCGGIFRSGPERLDAAIQAKIPYVVSCGAMDMVNFGSEDTIPDRFRGRLFFKHCENITLMRTNREENIRLGEVMAEKLNKATAPTVVFVPLKGFSALDTEGNVFYGPEEDLAFYHSIEKNINNRFVQVIGRELHINDEEFAKEMASKLHELIENSCKKG